MNKEPDKAWTAFRGLHRKRNSSAKTIAAVRSFDIFRPARTMWLRKWDGMELFSRPVRVLDFLKTFFNEGIYEGYIKTCLAQNVDGEKNVPLEEAFKDAYVYFTHFTRAMDNSVVSDVCALEALSRGMAWQLSPGDEEIDLLIPVAMKGMDQPLRRSDITFLGFRVRNRTIAPPAVSIDLDEFFSGRNDGRPYIVAVLELGHRIEDAEPRVKVNPPMSGWAPEEGSHPCYLFTVSQCDRKSFGIIGQVNGAAEDEAFEKLLRRGGVLTIILGAGFSGRRWWGWRLHGRRICVMS